MEWLTNLILKEHYKVQLKAISLIFIILSSVWITKIILEQGGLFFACDKDHLTYSLIEFILSKYSSIVIFTFITILGMFLYTPRIIIAIYIQLFKKPKSKPTINLTYNLLELQENYLGIKLLISAYSGILISVSLLNPGSNKIYSLITLLFFTIGLIIMYSIGISLRLKIRDIECSIKN